jgi:putative ABC transport system permease protein
VNLRALFRRSEVEQELDDELRFHIARETEKLMRQGMSPEEAELRARRAFGGVERIKDDTRDARGTAWIDALIHDVRYAIRGIRRRPGFAVAVVVTLGLGLGANVAMFAIVDRLLFRPPAFLKDQAQVHRVYLTQRAAGTDATAPWMTYTRYRDLARWSTAFSTLAAFDTRQMPVGRGEEARIMDVGVVSASYFDLFDAHAVAGRFFSSREDSVGAGAPVAVLSWTFWQTRYGGQPAIGETLEIGSLPCTIIGVAPREFAGVDTDQSVAAFVPINTYPINASGMTGNLFTHPSDYYLKYDGWQWMRMLARRRPGVNLAAATADLTHAFRTSYEAERAARAGTPTLEQAQPRAIVAPIQVERGPDATNVSRVALWTSGVALIVLLIACANVANLFLVRATERRREHALRIALGVSRVRLLAHVVTEIAILVAPAAILAVGIAVAGTQVLGALFLPGALATTVLGDPRTLAFAGAAALVAAGLTSVVPSLEIGRTNLAALIKEGARDSSRRTSRVRHALLFLQGALSVVLLVAAGLFVRSISNVRSVRLGYDVDPVLWVRPAWESAKLSDTARVELSRRLLDEARTIPGVSSAALGETVPFSTMLAENLFRVTHDTVLNWPKGAGFTLQAASPEYFHTLGTRVIRGRSITDADRAGAPMVMLVSEAMAKWLWPGQDAIGQCLRFADTAPCRTIVGITEGIKQSSLSDDPGTQYYLPIGQYHPENAQLFIRIDGDASRATETVRRHLQRLMPGGVGVVVTPMRDIMGREERSWQLGATMFVALGVLALVLAAVGLYSVIAYGVVQRTRELGVRVALGAETPDVVWLVLADGVRFTILGLVVGSAIALVGGRWVEPLLFGERATDPLVFGAVTGILTLTAVAASILPAHRATRVDPNTALRTD